MVPLRQAMIAVFAVVTAACEPAYSPPDGYVDSCYGGDFESNMVGLVPKVNLRVSADESQWDDLTNVLTEFGVTYGLDVFDTGISLSHVRMLEVSLCSSKGLKIYTTERIWTSGRHPDMDPGFTTVFLYQYHDEYEWEPVARALVDHFERAWDGEIAVEWRSSQDGA